MPATPDQIVHGHSTKPVSSNTRRGHLASRQEFVRDVEAAMARVLPTRSTPYGSVAVLGVTWERDTMGCRTAEANLMKVFSDVYNFKCETIKIPANETPHEFLQAKFIQFRERYAQNDSLLIYVYSGHAAVSNDYREMYWAAQTDENDHIIEPWAQWSEFGTNARSTRGRCLHIFDCCSAIAADYHNGPELLGAAGFTPSDTASDSLENSFTNVLARLLEDLNGAPKSVAQIFAELTRARSENGLLRTPVHLLEKDKESVVLGKQDRSRNHRTLQSEDRKKAILDLGESEYRVLISVSLVGEKSLPDSKQFTQWLTTNLPPDLRNVSIKVVSSMESDSVLLLVSMPVELWDGLPTDKTAYSFISFVKESSNPIQSSAFPGTSSGLSERKMKENVPFRPAGGSGRGYGSK